jgi:hypothetical protein
LVACAEFPACNEEGSNMREEDQGRGAIGGGNQQTQQQQTAYGSSPTTAAAQISNLTGGFVVIGKDDSGRVRAWSSYDEDKTRDFLRDAAPVLADIGPEMVG